MEATISQHNMIHVADRVSPYTMLYVVAWCVSVWMCGIWMACQYLFMPTLLTLTRLFYQDIISLFLSVALLFVLLPLRHTKVIACSY